MKITIFILLFFSLKLYSQNQTVRTYDPANNIYSNNYLNGINSGEGNTGIGATNSILAASLNPASISFTKKFQFGAQYLYKTYNTTSPASTSFNPFSGAIGIGAKLNKHFSLGFLYSNPQGSKFSNGTITVYGTNGNTSVNDAYSDYAMHSFTVPVNYDLKFKSSSLCFGLNFNYSYFRNSTNMATTETSPDIPQLLVQTVGKFNVQAGLLLRTSDKFSVGLTFTPGSTQNVNTTISDSSYTQEVKFPWNAGIGFQYVFQKAGLKINADYNYTGNIQPNSYIDRHYLNFGGEFALNKKLTLRGGVLGEFEMSRSLGSNITYISWRQVFITAGASIQFPKFELFAALLDSHLSPGSVYSTIFNAGIVSNF